MSLDVVAQYLDRSIASSISVALVSQTTAIDPMRGGNPTGHTDREALADGPEGGGGKRPPRPPARSEVEVGVDPERRLDALRHLGRRGDRIDRA